MDKHSTKSELNEVQKISMRIIDDVESMVATHQGGIDHDAGWRDACARAREVVPLYTTMLDITDRISEMSIGGAKGAHDRGWNAAVMHMLCGTPPQNGLPELISAFMEGARILVAAIGPAMVAVEKMVNAIEEQMRRDSMNYTPPAPAAAPPPIAPPVDPP